MCSCNKSKTGGVKKFTHTYQDSTGKTVTNTYSEEMEARQKASSLGGTVRAA